MMTFFSVLVFIWILGTLFGGGNAKKDSGPSLIGTVGKAAGKSIIGKMLK